jgi:hypothetical protein
MNLKGTRPFTNMKGRVPFVFPLRDVGRHAPAIERRYAGTSLESAPMQMNEHAGQAQPAPRPPSMDPATSAGRPSDNARQKRAERPSTARTKRTPVRYGAGF